MNNNKPNDMRGKLATTSAKGDADINPANQKAHPGILLGQGSRA
jgi:hypothetical protein